MSLKIFSTNSKEVISLFTQFSSFCRAHSTDALSSSGHIISASRFLFGCRIGRTYLIPSKSRIQDFPPFTRYRLQSQSIRRLVLVPPYFVFYSISFRCGGLSIERNQKPLTPENTLALTHHDKQKQVEVKRSSRANPHEIRLFSGCPYAVVKQGTKKFTKK